MTANSRNSQALQDSAQRVWPGMVIGDEGDRAHATGTSDHNADDPDTTPLGGRAEQTDTDTIPEVRADDFMIDGVKFTKVDAAALFEVLTRDPACQVRLSYVIYNRRIRRRKTGWVDEPYYGSDPHTGHVHASTLAAKDSDATRWAPVEALALEEDTMSATDVQTILNAIAKVQRTADAASIRARAIMTQEDVTTTWAADPKAIEVNALRDSVANIDVAAPDPVALKEAVALALTDATLKAAIIAALADPSILARFAKAVADEDHRRMES